ncbi:hypothetical protein, partial [Desulfovermiculus halophilus]|uniref:hypothetical protein n=1 Tax=Desulfovermiculus halophilus TaxID=339722 RepID=UPI000489B574
ITAGKGFEQVKAHDFQSCNPVEAMVVKTSLWWASGFVRLATEKARRFRLRVFFFVKNTGYGECISGRPEKYTNQMHKRKEIYFASQKGK